MSFFKIGYRVTCCINLVYFGIRSIYAFKFMYFWRWWRKGTNANVITILRTKSYQLIYSRWLLVKVSIKFWWTVTSKFSLSGIGTYLLPNTRRNLDMSRAYTWFMKDKNSKSKMIFHALFISLSWMWINQIPQLQNVITHFIYKCYKYFKTNFFV